MFTSLNKLLRYSTWQLQQHRSVENWLLLRCRHGCSHVWTADWAPWSHGISISLMFLSLQLAPCHWLDDAMTVRWLKNCTWSWSIFSLLMWVWRTIIILMKEEKKRSLLAFILTKEEKKKSLRAQRSFIWMKDTDCNKFANFVRKFKRNPFSLTAVSF